MPRFEYRLNDSSKKYPVVYYYEAMDEVEAAMRIICDYFVKEGRTYLKTHSSVEPPNIVIYVEEADDDPAEADNAQNKLLPGGIAVEVREYLEGAAEYPLVHQFGFVSQIQAVSYLIADSMVLFGQKWEKTSTEIDEDRRAYVYYCQKAKG